MQMSDKKQSISYTKEYSRLAQKKYYDANKEKCNQGRLRRTYVRDFGKEYVDTLYEKYDGDMSVIKLKIKMYRAYKRLNDNNIEVICPMESFL